MTEEDLSLEVLVQTEWLSVRSENICKSAGLLFLSDILSYHDLNGTFMLIKNCGVKSERELKDLCHKYQSLKQKLNKKPTILFSYFDFTSQQRLILEKYTEYLQTQLSVRAKNALNILYNGIKAEDILNTPYETDSTVKAITNVGKTTQDEISKFCRKINEFAHHVIEKAESNLSIELAKILLQIQNLNLVNDYNDLFLENGKIRLFKLMDIISKHDNIFSQNERTIFESLYKNIEIGGDILNKISQELHLSRERIRQIKLKIETEFWQYFSLIKNFDIADFETYNIASSDKKVIVLNEGQSKAINQIEHVNFNCSFFHKVFRMLFSNTHAVFCPDNLTNPKSNHRHSCCYLINNELFESFSYEAMLLQVSNMLSDKIPENYSIHFEGFLISYLKKKDKATFNEIVESCQLMLLNEFDLVVDLDGYLIFESNVKRQLHQYLYDIIKEASRQMTIDEISLEFRKRHPEVNFTSDSIRGTLIRAKDLFICFGRTSTYALREWELEKENFKGGTIRDIVYDFLLNQSLPVHISSIWKYVEQYRETTYARSILDNIKADESARFVFITGGFIGLKNKVYDLENLNFRKLIGSHFTRNTLTKFNGWELTDFIKHYESRFGYQPVQVEYAILNKVEEGELNLTIDNRLII